VSIDLWTEWDDARSSYPSLSLLPCFDRLAGPVVDATVWYVWWYMGEGVRYRLLPREHLNVA